MLATVAACATSVTPEPTKALVMSPEPTPTASTPTATASPVVPGSIVVLGCEQPATLDSLCLADAAGTVDVRAIQGSNLALTITVKNPGEAPTTPVSVLLYIPDPGKLPLGQPICTTCNSTAGSSVIGLEWPALAPGETRALIVQIPVTRAVSSTWFAALYAEPLADVMAAQIANGIEAGQQTWTIAMAVAIP